jgi:hypothetical protein
MGKCYVYLSSESIGEVISTSLIMSINILWFLWTLKQQIEMFLFRFLGTQETWESAGTATITCCQCKYICILSQIRLENFDIEIVCCMKFKAD